MLHVNFNDLIERYPQYCKVLERLKEWLDRNVDKGMIDPRELAWAWRKDGEVTMQDLAETLTLLVREGYLRQLYMVVNPAGALAGNPETGRGFDSPVEVPPVLPDAFNRSFPTNQSEIVPVFEGKGSDERK